MTIMQQLNLPEYSFKYRQNNSATEIFDISRKKFIKLTPEEWVRQNFLMFLISEKSFPASLITVEKTLKYNKLTKKADIVIYDNTGAPRIIVECKAPSVKISQEVFDQLARYNLSIGRSVLASSPLKVDYLVVTNGMEHFCCKMDYTNSSWLFVNDIPNYASIKI
jgi:hypothetical protein